MTFAELSTPAMQLSGEEYFMNYHRLVRIDVAMQLLASKTSLLADDLHFGFHLMPRCSRARRLDGFDQREHVFRRSAALVHDEVAVDFRYACRADAVFFNPSSCTSFSGGTFLDGF